MATTRNIPKATPQQYDAWYEKFEKWGLKVQRDIQNLESHMARIKPECLNPPEFKAGDPDRL